MTAPGNAPLLITILAMFVACAGYAAGRLHQWYRTGLDRDEAYRDGYDTATRSTFSLAARIIGPRRDRAAIRASASVHAASVQAARAGSAGAVPPSAQPAAGAARRPAGAPAPVSSLFDSAAKATGSSVTSSGEAAPDDETATPKRHRKGRHFVPDELVRAVTHRLAPDRLARAKVRQVEPTPDPAADEDASPRRAVPKPRAS